MKELEEFIKEMQRIEQSIKFQMTDLSNFRIEFNSFKETFFRELKEIKEELKEIKKLKK